MPPPFRITGPRTLTSDCNVFVNQRRLLYRHRQLTMSTSANPPPPRPLPPLTLIVATTPSLGIGLRGSLPWPPLKAALQFFARVTKRPPHSPLNPSFSPRQADGPETPSPLNAVIMGRKTFDSIPSKFRPLKDRINIVITRSPESTSLLPHYQNKDVVIASSISEALPRVQDQHKDLGRVFVIGGAQIYKQAIGMSACERVLWTRLTREWECDTWFPRGVVGDGVDEGVEGPHGWKRKTKGQLEEWVKEDGVGGPRREGDIEFEVTMWERVKEIV